MSAAPEISGTVSFLAGSRDAIVDDVTVDDGTEDGPGTITFRDLKETARRYRRLWVAIALVGLLIGAAFHLLVPAKYAATSDLYMSEPLNVDPAQALPDDVSLLQTSAVAERAVTALHLGPAYSANGAAEFLGMYQGSAISDVILRVKLSAPSKAAAVRDTTAVVKAFFEVRDAELTSQTQVIVAGLNEQLKGLNSDVDRLNSAIGTLSAGSNVSQTSSQLAQLVSERSADLSQVSQLQVQMQQDLLDESSVVKGSHVLDPAAPVKVSEKKLIAEDGISGLVAGLALGLGGVIVWSVLSDRPRRRSDVAAALGAPVELSLDRFRKRRFLRKWRLRRVLRKRGLDLRLAEGRLMAHLGAVNGSGLAVVALEATEMPAALMVAATALSLASEGRNVVVVDSAGGRPLGRIFGANRATGAPTSVSFAGHTIRLVVATDDPGELARLARPAGTGPVLVLTGLDPAIGADHLAAWASGAVIVLTAGETTAVRLAATAQMLDRAGLPVRSAILVGAGREDESVGLGDKGPRHAHRVGEGQRALPDPVQAAPGPTRRPLR